MLLGLIETPGKGKTLGEALSLSLGVPPCLAVAELLPASFLFPRTGWGTAHPTPLKALRLLPLFWGLGASWTLPTLMSLIGGR